MTAFFRNPLLTKYASGPGIVLGLAVVIGLVSLYVTTQAARKPEGTPACMPSQDTGEAVVRAAKGEVAAFQAFKTPRQLPELAFKGPSDAAMSLAQFKGKTVLLNLWATWCAPCRKEMPALDALQAEFGGSDFEVVAINIDTRNLDRPRTWLAENSITRLAYYSDHEAKVFQDLKRAGQAIGMPTTLLVDAKGCQLGVLHGPAEWASDDAKRLIRAAMGR
jgi:thiol-disulfide isomerase/thioredoxin